MRRRTVLAAVVGSFGATAAGCVGDSTSGAGESSLTLSIADTDADPGPFAFDVSVLEDSLTGTTVPRVTLAVENAGTEPASWRYGGSTPDLPFPRAVATEPSGLTADLVELVDPETDTTCAHLSARGRDDAIVETTLEPGDVVEREYAVVGVEADLETPCPAPDVYRFEADYDEHGRWGFAVRLTGQS